MTRSCARRSLAAETIFMALVICCVFLTERMRRRISIRLGMGGFGLVRDEARLVLVEQLGDAAAQIVVERLLGADIVENLAMRGFGEGIETGLELAAEPDVDI